MHKGQKQDTGLGFGERQSLWSANEKLAQELDVGRQALMELDRIQDQAIAIIKEYTDGMMGTSEQDKRSLLDRDQAINERDQAINERDQAINERAEAFQTTESAHRGAKPSSRPGKDQRYRAGVNENAL